MTTPSNPSNLTSNQIILSIHHLLITNPSPSTPKSPKRRTKVNSTPATPFIQRRPSTSGTNHYPTQVAQSLLPPPQKHLFLQQHKKINSMHTDPSETLASIQSHTSLPPSQTPSSVGSLSATPTATKAALKSKTATTRKNKQTPNKPPNS